jgi:uncharacterized protein YkwD
MRITRRMVLGVVAGTITLGLMPHAQAADDDDRTVLFDLMNSTRVSSGLAPFALDEAMSISACAWNDQLTDGGPLAHDPNLAVSGGAYAPGWQKLGENLGVGPSPELIYDALVASPSHLANIVDPTFSKVGICTGYNEDDQLVTTQRFVAFEPVKAKPAKVARSRKRRRRYSAS